jgi:hypothetical protein
MPTIQPLFPAKKQSFKPAHDALQKGQQHAGVFLFGHMRYQLGSRLHAFSDLVISGLEISDSKKL